MNRITPMKNTLLYPFFLFLLSLGMSPAYGSSPHGGTSHSNQKGVGIILGDPSGLTGKFWLGSDRAVDAGLAFSMDHYFFIYSDYLFHFKPIHTIKPYIGIGGGLSVQSKSLGIGLRIPFGGEWFIPSAPFAVFLEVTPGIGILPSTNGFVQGGLGVRYYFE
jgi:hypothetical protein